MRLFDDRVCDNCDGSGEWYILVILAEEFVELTGSVVASSRGECDEIVKKK